MSSSENPSDEPTTTDDELDRPEAEFRDILSYSIPTYRDEHSANELADLLDDMRDDLRTHDWIPARTGPGRAWVQIASWTRGALDSGADPAVCRGLLLGAEIALRRDGYDAFSGTEEVGGDA